MNFLNVEEQWLKLLDKEQKIYKDRAIANLLDVTQRVCVIL